MASDVVVIGGGAIGVASALELARRGARVTLLERGAELGWGCSAGNAGLICPSHSYPIATPAALRLGLRWMLRPDSPFYLRPRPAVLPWLARFTLACTAERAHAAMEVIRSLSVASLALHAKLAEAGLDTGFERRGVLNVYESEEAFAEARKEAGLHAGVGIHSEILDPDAARALEPALGGSFAGAVYYPDEAQCDPLRFVHAVGRAAAEAGAEIRTRVEVLRLRGKGDRVETLETTTGELRPGTVVLAAGSWTPELAQTVGLSVPIEGGKGYHVELEPAQSDPRIPIFFQGSRVIATPLPGRLRLAGTLELAGLDMSVSPVRVEAIMRAARSGVRGLEGRRILAVWRGLRPCPPDGLPVVGRTSAVQNLVLASGHAMMGLTLAPITGRLVAEIVSGETPSLDVGALGPDRFRSPLARS